MVQFRRSKKAGPFRFTVSQRGLSSSIGGGLFRVGVGADRPHAYSSGSDLPGLKESGHQPSPRDHDNDEAITIGNRPH